MTVQSTAVAESSPAPEAPKFTQYDGWDEEGTPVVTKKPASPQPKPAESAAADASKETNQPGSEEGEAESATGTGKQPTQETHRKPGAEARIKELTARTKQLEKELEQARKPKETKPAESSTARQPEPRPAEPPPTRPRPTQADKDEHGKPKYANFEEFSEALTDWKVEQALAKERREQQTAQQMQQMGQFIKDAEAKYADFKQKANPLVAELLKGDSHELALSRLNRSPHLADVLYTIGSSAESSADFMKAMRSDPGKAIEVIVLMEQEIAKELAKGGAGGERKPGDGETRSTPVPPTPRAPKPPAEVGGRGAPGEDALVTAAKAGDFRSFDAEQTRRAVASRR